MKRSLFFAIIPITAIVVWYAVSDHSEASKPKNGGEGVNPLQWNQTASDGEVAFPVSVSVAQRGALTKSISTNGTLRAKREVELIARIAGEVRSVSAFNGKFVQAGDILMRLDDREYKLAHEKASSALLAAQVEYRTLSTSSFLGAGDSARVQQELAALQQRFEEAQTALREKKIDEETYQRALREYEANSAYLKANRGDIVANKSGLAQAREAYERAKMSLEWTEVRAPFAGYVADCDLAIGKQLQAGSVVCKVVDLLSLLADVEIVETEAGKVAVGQKAEITVASVANTSFAGKVQMLNPVIDAKTKTLKATIELSSSQIPKRLLIPGMYVTVKIQTESFANRLIVPKAALLVRDQRSLVFVAQSGLAKWHYVDVGEDNEQFLAIRSGIDAGDTVIVDGHYTLAHDAKIRVTK